MPPHAARHLTEPRHRSPCNRVVGTGEAAAAWQRPARRPRVAALRAPARGWRGAGAGQEGRASCRVRTRGRAGLAPRPDPDGPWPGLASTQTNSAKRGRNYPFCTVAPRAGSTGHVPFRARISRKPGCRRHASVAQRSAPVPAGAAWQEPSARCPARARTVPGAAIRGPHFGAARAIGTVMR